MVVEVVKLLEVVNNAKIYVVPIQTVDLMNAVILN
jgi:hypothetical protein